MRAVFEAPYAIPELGVDRGDVLVVRPDHPTDPLMVAKRFDHTHLPLILGHLHRLTPVSLPSADLSRPAELQRWLLRRPGRPRRHLVVVK